MVTWHVVSPNHALKRREPRNCSIGKIATTLAERWDEQQWTRHPLRLSCALVVGEEEDAILKDWPPQSSAKLVTLQSAAGLVKKVTRIEVTIAQEFKG